LILCGASYVTVGGESVIFCSRDISWLEWSIENGRVSFSCSDETAIRCTSWEHLRSLERWAALKAAII